MAWIGFLLLPVGYIINGFVLSILWGWFMVPTLNLPALTAIQAIGISLAIGFLTAQSNHLQFYLFDKLGKPDREGFVILTTFLTDSLAVPLLTLVFGWVVHLLM